MKFPAILVQVHFYTPIPQTVKKKLMDLSISWNFLQFWFKCILPPPPSFPQLAKQWKNFFIYFYFFNGFIHFMKFPAILVQVHFLPPPLPIDQTMEKILVDLSISWNFPLMMTIACRHVGIWDQLVLLFFEDHKNWIILNLNHHHYYCFKIWSFQPVFWKLSIQTKSFLSATNSFEKFSKVTLFDPWLLYSKSVTKQQRLENVRKKNPFGFPLTPIVAIDPVKLFIVYLYHRCFLNEYLLPITASGQVL